MKRLARYTRVENCYGVWAPDSFGVNPDVWFRSLTELRRFAAGMGWRLEKV